MKLKTQSGATEFSGLVLVSKEGFSVEKVGNAYIAVDAKGKEIGTVDPETTLVFGDDEGEEILVKDLIPAISGADLVGKNPNDLSKEELVILTMYLQEQAGAKVANIADKKAGKATKTDKKAEKKEEAASAGDRKTYTREELEAMGAKDLWKEVIQPIADQLEGITSRSKKDEMIAAYLKFIGAEEEAPAPAKEEKKAEKKGKKAPEPVEEEDDEDDEEEEDEEDTDDEEDEDEDDSDDSDDDEDEDDDEEEDDDEDSSDEDDESDDDEDEDDEDDDEDEEEDDEDEDDVYTEEDIDELEDAKEIKLIMKKHGLKLPEDVKPTLKNIRAFLKKKLVGKKK